MLKEPGMRVLRKIVLIPACMLFVTGCGALRGLERMQNNMDHMVYYMGIMASNMPVMANSTQRMAQNTDRMMAKTDGLMADLQQKGKSGERAIQNYSQATFDNDKAKMNYLKGIRDELGSLKQALLGPGLPKPDLDRTRIRDLETRLEALTAKVKELEKKAP
jgi:hypothetical protein